MFCKQYSFKEHGTAQLRIEQASAAWWLVSKQLGIALGDGSRFLETVSIGSRALHRDVQDIVLITQSSDCLDQLTGADSFAGLGVGLERNKCVSLQLIDELLHEPNQRS